MNIDNKLSKLRNLFKENGIDGYILSTRDEYLSEYPPSYAKRLEYLTGFTGSNGLAIILKNTVLFFTDGRYITQSYNHLDANLFQIFNQNSLNNFPWQDHILPNLIIGYDPKIFTDNMLLPFKTFNLTALPDNLIDKIWPDQPLKPSSKIYNYDIIYAGVPAEDKINRCRKFLNDYQAQSLIITNPEAVCWLLNIRASDIEFSPLLLACACITQNGAYLFTDISRIEKDVIDTKNFIEILPPDSLAGFIQELDGKILFDDKLGSKYILDIIKQKEHQLIQDPGILWKACKNEVEISRMVEGHIDDAVAVCEFLAFLDTNDISNHSEYDLGLKLTEFRAKSKKYVCDSFPAIIGFQENGAIIHYRALKETAKKIIGNGLLLIDSGGQYLGATTDITRVVFIGTPKHQHKEYYTKILKGHLALAMIKFPVGSISGANLDVLARQFLWNDGEDYAHGTGHGVGSFLSVHEGPQNIALNSYHTKIAQGMVLSNEPGFYLPGEFGIRIENMMYVKNSNKVNFLEFDMLTLVPYEKKLILSEMLSKMEIEYLINYYHKIEEKIMPHLSIKAKKWLQEQMILR